MEQDKEHNVDVHYVRELERTVADLTELLRIANESHSVHLRERDYAFSSLADCKDLNSVLNFRNCQLRKLALHALNSCCHWRAKYIQMTLDQFDKPDEKLIRHRNELMVWSSIFEDAWKRDVKKFRSFFPRDFLQRIKRRHVLEGVNHG